MGLFALQNRSRPSVSPYIINFTQHLHQNLLNVLSITLWHSIGLLLIIVDRHSSWLVIVAFGLLYWQQCLLATITVCHA